jgi:hypothetical protein
VADIALSIEGWRDATFLLFVSSPPGPSRLDELRPTRGGVLGLFGALPASPITALSFLLPARAGGTVAAAVD